MISKKKKVFYTIIILISVIIFSLVKYSEEAFGGAQMPQIIYTIILPKGTSLDVFLNGLFFCVKLVLKLGFVALFPLFINLKIKNKDIKYKGIYTIVLSLILFIYSITSVGLHTYIYDELTKSNFLKENYVDPKSVKIEYPENKKNLIYILVESLEASYENTEFDGKDVNLIPYLSSLASDNINFSSDDNLGGFKNYPLANWTAAGTLAQMSGLPLRVRLNLTDYGYHDKFLNNAVMLGDILKDAGYKNYHLTGSDSAFGAEYTLFTNHGYEIEDYNYAKENGLIPEDYYEFWGYEDRKLFSFAKDKLESISQDEEPFSMVISTIDTHPIDGYLDKECSDTLNYQYGSSILCEDSIIEDFITWVQSQDFYDNTVIVITGDHISMQTDIKEHLKDKNREIYNVFINTGISFVNSKNRDITPFDMYPTILYSLGFKIENNRLGLGTNLFSDEKTITEKYGYEYVIKELPKYSNFYYDKFM